MKLLHSYLDRQTDYFNSYLEIQKFIKIDIDNDKLDDLESHIQNENLILSKIVKLSKIISNRFNDLKITDSDEHRDLFEKQETIEKLQTEAVRCNLNNTNLLKLKKKSLADSFNSEKIDFQKPYFTNNPPQFLDITI